MDRLRPIVIGSAIVIVAVIALGTASVILPGHGNKPNLAPGYAGMIPAERLLRVPITGIYPGGNPSGLEPNIQNPLKNDPDAVARGMKDFDNFNCSGCHMANGGGGMGPSLSDRIWIYRDSSANIYLSIAQGRSAGMPAFGAMLPDRTIWELVSYIESISNDPDHAFGITTSATPQTPLIEQVPAGQVQSPTPWRYTEPMRPNGEKNDDTAPDAPLPPDSPRPPGTLQH